MWFLNLEIPVLCENPLYPLSGKRKIARPDNPGLRPGLPSESPEWGQGGEPRVQPQVRV
jgi:hypothetical protein